MIIENCKGFLLWEVFVVCVGMRGMRSMRGNRWRESGMRGMRRSRPGMRGMRSLGGGVAIILYGHSFVMMIITH